MAAMLFLACFCTYGCSNGGFKPIRRLEMYGKNKNDFSYLINSFGSHTIDEPHQHYRYITEDEYLAVPEEQRNDDSVRAIEDDYVIPKKYIGKTYYKVFFYETKYRYKEYYREDAKAWFFLKYSINEYTYDIPYAKIVNNKTIIVRYGYDMTETKFENIAYYNIEYHKTE